MCVDLIGSSSLTYLLCVQLPLFQSLPPVVIVDRWWPLVGYGIWRTITVCDCGWYPDSCALHTVDSCPWPSTVVYDTHCKHGWCQQTEHDMGYMTHARRTVYLSLTGQFAEMLDRKLLNSHTPFAACKVTNLQIVQTANWLVVCRWSFRLSNNAECSTPTGRTSTLESLAIGPQPLNCEHCDVAPSFLCRSCLFIYADAAMLLFAALPLVLWAFWQQIPRNWWYYVPLFPPGSVEYCETTEVLPCRLICTTSQKVSKFQHFPMHWQVFVRYINYPVLGVFGSHPVSVWDPHILWVTCTSVRLRFQQCSVQFMTAILVYQYYIWCLFQQLSRIYTSAKCAQVSCW